MERSSASQLTFGKEARELNARALPIRTAPSDSRWALAFNPSGLSSVQHAALAALPGSEFGAGEFWVDGKELGRLAETEPIAAYFLQAHLHSKRPIEPPKIMGVLNITPDSFSDGGLYSETSSALARARELERQGADLIDIGGESTRPGAPTVSEEEELARVLPVIEKLARETKLPLSIDTSKAGVTAKALVAGCTIVNDVSGGLFDPEILSVVADHGATYVCMHTLGRPETMQTGVHYDDPTAEVCSALRLRVEACLEAGITLEKIVIDPGIGFGKRLADNLDLLRRLFEFRSLGLPLLLGVSRKSFIGQLAPTGQAVLAAEAADRIGGTAAAIAACVTGGAEFLRVHDVAAMSEAARVAYAVHSSDSPTAS